MTYDFAPLIAHWPLGLDARDHSSLQQDTRAIDVALGFPGPHGQPDSAARFNGQHSLLQTSFAVPDEFTFAAWICTEGDTDIIGDVCSQFDSAKRNGFHVSIVTNSGVTSTAQANFRQLQFGIDDARHDSAWTNCGRPGNTVLIAALATVGGKLYAGTLENGAEEMGHLWRYEGGQDWVDLGNPLKCNVVHSLAQFDGALYCGLGRYLARITSNLEDERNKTPGGHVFRLDADGHWTDCGHPGHEDATPETVPTNTPASGKADDVFALTVFQGALYGVSNHRRGVFRYGGETHWECVGLTEHRVLTLTVYRRCLYALLNGDAIYRYVDGSDWELCARLPGATQLHAASTYEGQLYVGTWPECDVFRYNGENWTKLKRVGWEREVMSMANYNGKMYLGTLPMANVWRMDGDEFTYMGTLDHSDAALRRVWSMAVYDGKLFAGTLPGGYVRSMEAGSLATWDRCFPAGWHHIAAVKGSRRLELYVDGQCVARSAPFDNREYELNSDRPLQIGRGPHEHFDGLMSDIRFYGRALDAKDVKSLAHHKAMS